MKRLKSCLLLLVALFSLSVSGQNELIDTLVSRFQTQVYNFPQEKVHLSTDRSSYFCGDTIWFRGFIVDASTHVPVNASKYLYVELVNPFDSIVSRVKILERDGVYSGYVPLETLYAEGDYELVAYTMFMENSGRDYFFRKPVVLTSPFSVQSNMAARFERDGDEVWVTVDYTDKSNGAYKSYDRMSYKTCDAVEHVRRSGSERVTFCLKKGELDKPYVLLSFGNYKKFVRIPESSPGLSVSFHPEGGYLIPGVDCRVAFKAIDGEGMGVDVSGVIKDGDGNTVCRMQSVHRGMGDFHFRPSLGSSYYAEVSSPSGEELKFPLPAVEPRAAVIHLDSRGDTLLVSSHGRTPSGSFLLLQQRGRVLASAPIGNGSPQYFLKSWFPPGLLQILLLDTDATVLSERLSFIRDESGSHAFIEPDSAYYDNREKVRLTLSLDGYSQPEGSVSVSVTDDGLVSGSNNLPIDVQLLLQSDIAGHIEAPSYYFEDVDSVKDYALDILLMTQGWKRYDVPKVLHGIYSEPVYPLEVGQEISGEVRRLILRSPREGVNVNILSPTEGFSAVASTDENGRFHFNGFNHPEGTNYAVQAYTKDGDKILNFEVFDQKFPYTGFVGPDREYVAKDKSGPDNDALVINANPSMREILLDEITVVGRKKEKYSDVYELLASDTYDTDYIKDNGITSLSEIILKIPGISEREGYLYFRNGLVNFMVNGVIELSGYGSNELTTKLYEIEMMYNIDMIKRVDFLPPNMALVFGSRATPGGLIVLTLKNVEEMKMSKNPLHLQIYSPLGYQKPLEIYTPKYTVNNNFSNGSDLRTTIFWKPDLRFDDSGKAIVEFYTSDMVDTRYSVNVEGLTDDGNIIKGNCKIAIGEDMVEVEE